MPSVLFVCTGNVCRSPAAAAIFSHMLRQHRMAHGWHVGSAGTWARPGARLHPHVERALWELGVGPVRHRARPITPQLMAQANVILGMTQYHVEALRAEFPLHADRVHLFSEMAGHTFDIPDPVALTLEEVRHIVAEIASVTRDGFHNLVQHASRHAPRSREFRLPPTIQTS